MAWNKYQQQKKQVSYDSGTTWQDVIPYQYRAGALLEANSPDCTPEDPECPIQFRWIDIDSTIETMCFNGDEYSVQKQQMSLDCGATWIFSGQTRTNQLLIPNSSCCDGNTYICNDGILYLTSNCDDTKPYCTISGNILRINVPQNTDENGYVLQSTLEILGISDTSSYYTYNNNGSSSYFDINLNTFNFVSIPSRIYQMSISFKKTNGTLKYWVSIQQFIKGNNTYIYAYPDTATCPRSSLLYFNKTNNTNDYSHYSDIEGFAASHNVTTYDNTSLGNICTWRNEYNGTDTTATINGKTYSILSNSQNYILPPGENHYIVWVTSFVATLVDIVSDSEVYQFGNNPPAFYYTNKAAKMNIMKIGTSTYASPLPVNDLEDNNYNRIINLYGMPDVTPTIGYNTTINHIGVENCQLT